MVCSNQPAMEFIGSSYIGFTERCKARTLDFYLGHDLILMSTFCLVCFFQEREGKTKLEIATDYTFLQQFTPHGTFLFHGTFSQSITNKLDYPILGMQVWYIFTLTILV